MQRHDHQQRHQTGLAPGRQHQRNAEYAVVGEGACHAHEHPLGPVQKEDETADAHAQDQDDERAAEIGQQHVGIEVLWANVAHDSEQQRGEGDIERVAA